MFSIYGISGQIFHGSLEEMKRVHALAKTRASRAISRDDAEPGVETEAGRSHEEAIQAYRAMLPGEIERGPLYHAEPIMQRQVISVSDSDDVARAWQVLREQRIHQAPVLSDNAQLVGIVSERDLLTALNIDSGQIVESLSRQVRDVMTTPVVSAAPVTHDNGRLLGFVSRSDFLRAIVTDPPLSLWR